MHYRLVVESSKRVSGTPYDFAFKIDTFPLNYFNSKPVHFAVEWATPLYATEAFSYNFTSEAIPYAVLLDCPSIKQANSCTSWDRGYSSVIAMLPGNKDQHGIYGVTNDSSHLESSVLGFVARPGDVLRDNGVLHFRILKTDGETTSGVKPWTPVQMLDYTFSLVFWSVEVPRSLSYDHFIVWLATSDRSSGISADCHIPLGMPTLSMDEGVWNAAVSYISPIHYTWIDGPSSLILESESLGSPSSNTRAIAHLAPEADGDVFYGRRLSVKPSVHSDTLGLAVPTSIDRLHEFHLKLVDGLDRSDVVESVKDYTVCLTFYRLS